MTISTTHSMENTVARSATERLLSLDVFCGLTIAGMVLVNPGSWNHIYWPLAHASWHGWTPTDLIFPFFLFIVGVAIPLALGPNSLMFAIVFVLLWPGLVWILYDRKIFIKV